MSTTPHAAPPPPTKARRRWLRRGLLVAVLLLAAGAALQWLARPQQVARIILQQAGNALGLVITAERADYRLRGLPMLALHGVDARQPGATVPVFTARQAQLSLPWSTLRSRGAQLAIERIDLDAPVVHLAALQTWLSSRPPSEGAIRIPDITHGLHVRNGRLDGGAWQLENIAIGISAVHPGQALHATVAGQYRDAGTRIHTELQVNLGEPALVTSLQASGPLQITQYSWSMQGQAHLHGPLRMADGDLHIAPATFGYHARIRSTDSDLPLRLGVHGPFGHVDGVTRWGLSSLLLQQGNAPDSLLPPVRARGAVAYGKQLVMRLHGQLDTWPEAWPALPPPVGASGSPLPFALAYTGKANLGDVTSLQLRRDATAFDARFRLPDVLAWVDESSAGSPLPPLSGTLHTPRMVISGAKLEGVEITLDDPALPAASP